MNPWEVRIWVLVGISLASCLMSRLDVIVGLLRNIVEAIPSPFNAPITPTIAPEKPEIRWKGKP